MTTGKPSDRSYFERGGRHSLEHRISDFGPRLMRLDLSAYTAIDIGCAEGDITEWLAMRFGSVDAIEYMDECFRKARSRFENDPQVTVRQADISSSPLITDYDFVFFLGVLHFFTSEDARARILRHCLEHARYGCFVRTAIHEFRVRDQRNIEHLNHFVSLRALDSAAGTEFDLQIIDNGFLGDGDHALGDLIVYRRRCPNNPLPPLCEYFSDLLQRNTVAGSTG